MQYLQGTDILCITADELVTNSIMTEENLRQMKRREKIAVHGVGGNDRERLVEYESLPQRFQQKVHAVFGDPYEYFAMQPLLAMLQRDMEARAFYAGYVLPDGKYLPERYQRRYSRQCDWLNLVNTVLGDKQGLRDNLQITVGQFYDIVLRMIAADKEDNGLPSSERRLKERNKQYKDNGYAGLISKHFCNQKTRKVDKDIERLLIALYLTPDKPYLKAVCGLYEEFIAGAITVVDVETGEVFNPQDFYVDGQPYAVSESTVSYYINQPANRAAIDKKRVSALEFSTKHRPYNNRRAPEYALSKITMDDIALPFKMHDGKRAWSYQIFDVASQAIIGVSFAKDKNKDLVKDSLRDMLRNICVHGMGMPMEVEVEQHLNADMKGHANAEGEFVADVMTEGALFPFVRFCRGGNPQEKRAERFIQNKKLQFQKRREGFQMRPFARLEANRKNEDLKDKLYHYEEIVANERADIEAYNNSLHPNQDKYAGLTRWEVLQQHQNPKLPRPNVVSVLPYIGHVKSTSIRRGYVQISGDKYRLGDLSALERIGGNKVVAYYLTDDNGMVWYAHLFDERDNPICEAIAVEAYNEAKAERTEDDERIIREQAEYVAKYDAMVKRLRSDVPKVGVVYEPIAEEEDEAAVEVVTSTQSMQQNDDSAEGYYTNEQEDVTDFEDEESMRNRAIDRL